MIFKIFTKDKQIVELYLSDELKKFENDYITTIILDYCDELYGIMKDDIILISKEYSIIYQKNI